MSSTALVKAREDASSARSALSKFRREARSPGAKIADVVSVQAGAAAAGVVAAIAPPTMMGVPTELGGALVLVGIGIATGSPTAVLAAAGMAAPTVRNYVATVVATATAGSK